MNKLKPRSDVTDAELDAPIACGNEYDQYVPCAVKATYRKKDDMLAITFATGVELAIPRRLLQGLENADPREIAKVQILGPGTALHWEPLDVDHNVPGLIRGVFGSRNWMSAIGRIGGLARTTAKGAASRSNGSKGGRPCKLQEVV